MIDVGKQIVQTRKDTSKPLAFPMASPPLYCAPRDCTILSTEINNIVATNLQTWPLCKSVAWRQWFRPSKRIAAASDAAVRWRIRRPLAIELACRSLTSHARHHLSPTSIVSLLGQEHSADLKVGSNLRKSFASLAGVALHRSSSSLDQDHMR